jgi:hypothetical protein
LEKEWVKVCIIQEELGEVNIRRLWNRYSFLEIKDVVGSM